MPEPLFACPPDEPGDGPQCSCCALNGSYRVTSSQDGLCLPCSAFRGEIHDLMHRLARKYDAEPSANGSGSHV